MARIPKIDLEPHFFTRGYMALLQSGTRPPRFEVSDETVHVWLEPSPLERLVHVQRQQARPGPPRHDSQGGAGRVLFASDYPWEPIGDGADVIEAAPISEDDRRKICHENAARLFDLSI